MLAERFSDRESHAGTVDNATHFMQAGLTTGYSQDHTGFYVPNGRPKNLWLRELANALVTADPLHNKADTARVIVEKGGDYLIGTKENTPKLALTRNVLLASFPLRRASLRRTSSNTTTAIGTTP